ncbi:MAG: hypothetical protein BWY38_02726 [Ignavibacteria bacterium ADurb.Bin266]|nr:MAG: hypothetical protein BWY38_02726 [Ignavibacteria bacterium ADurb.Bin266]
MELELEKFITESLLSIHGALKKVNNKLTKDYPDEKKKNTFLLKPGSSKKEGAGIHFDLAITSKTNKETGGKVKICVWFPIGASGKRIQNKNDESVSRISFTVDVSRYVGGYNKK